MTKTVKQVLLSAAEYLETHGWVRGEYYEPGTQRCCMLGALAVGLGAEELETVDFDTETETYLGKLTQHAIAEMLPGRTNPHDGTAIVEWNDNKARSQDEVIAMLRDVAAKVAL